MILSSPEAEAGVHFISLKFNSQRINKNSIYILVYVLCLALEMLNVFIKVLTFVYFEMPIGILLFFEMIYFCYEILYFNYSFFYILFRK